MTNPNLKVLIFPNNNKSNVLTASLPKDKIELVQLIKKEHKSNNVIVIFDDNDDPKDLREMQHYNYLFKIMDEKSLQWEVIFGRKKGQHYNHQMANTMGYEWVWRLDDDTIAESNVLEKLLFHIGPKIGSIGGSVLTPPFIKGLTINYYYCLTN